MPASPPIPRRTRAARPAFAAACAALASATLASAALPALADTVLALAPPPAVGIAALDPGNTQFLGIDGDATVASPSWEIVNWNAPAPLPAGLRVPAGANWRAAGPFAQAAWLAALPALELVQDGNVASLPCNTENDLFLQAVSPGSASGTAGLTPSAPLSQLASIRLELGTQLVSEQVSPRCADGPNYVAYTAAVVLTDRVQAPPQTLFFQLILRDSRGQAIARSWCPGLEAADSPVFCLGDGLASVFGLPAPQPGGGHRSYALELLPELRQILATGHAKAGFPGRVLDADPSHWRLTGFYAGQLLMGGAQASSRWDRIGLRTSP